jgi:hypothetical protein
MDAWEREEDRRAHPRSPEPVRPAPLLAGLFAGFASVSLTLWTYWPFAVFCPAAVALAAVLIPFPGHLQFARGAFDAVLGVLVFEVLHVVLVVAAAVVQG